MRAERYQRPAGRAGSWAGAGPGCRVGKGPESWEGRGGTGLGLGAGRDLGGKGGVRAAPGRVSKAPGSTRQRAGRWDSPGPKEGGRLEGIGCPGRGLGRENRGG